MTKDEVIQKIKEIIAKDPHLKGTIIKVKFSDKKSHNEIQHLLNKYTLY